MRSLHSFNMLLVTVLLAIVALSPFVTAYQVLISQSDEVRQVCSGMWGKGKQDAFIEGVYNMAMVGRSLSDTFNAVIFGPSSRGQVALVIYEWQDASHLGIDKNGQSTEDTWSDEVSFSAWLAKALVCLNQYH